jgi:hypothetical protein
MPIHTGISTAPHFGIAPITFGATPYLIDSWAVQPGVIEGTVTDGYGRTVERISIPNTGEDSVSTNILYTNGQAKVTHGTQATYASGNWFITQLGQTYQKAGFEIAPITLKRVI